MYIEKFKTALDAVIKLDPSLGSIAADHVFTRFLETYERPSSFQYIVESIISQQLSGLAASAIRNKFIAHYSAEDFPTPQQILASSHEELRSVGLSNQKVKYVQGVAKAYEEEQLSDEILQNSTADEIVDRLVALHGVGAWSAQMFLLFYHRHMDVFSPGDLGIQRGFKRYMELEGGKEIKKTRIEDVTDEDLRPHGTSKKALQKAPLPPECKHMAAVASKFKPYRSAFQLILWRLSDTIVAIGKRPTESEKGAARKKVKKIKAN